MKQALPAGLTADDYDISATIRELRKLDPLLDRARSLLGEGPATLLDVGCGIGGLTTYVGNRLGIDDMIGIDRDPDRLTKASERGIRTIQLDLDREPIPLDDGSIGMAVSFGVFEHVVWYDNILREVARVLGDGAPFVISMPNLGSFVNRFALLLGYQPREVEVSWEIGAGIMPIYRRAGAGGRPTGHVHSATLRCMSDLLDHFGFDIVLKRGFSPDFGVRALRAADAVFERFPSLSRRFTLLARRRPRAGQPAT